MKVKVMAMISNLNDGGAQRVLLNHAKLFTDDEDIEFVIYSYEKPTGSIYDKEVKKENLNVVYLNKDRHKIKMKYIGDIFNFFITNYEWYKAIKKYEPDVVHTHVTEILRKSVFGIKLSGVKKKYSTLHSNPLRYKGSSYLAAKLAFKYFKFVPVCITKEQKKIARRHYKFNNGIIIRNGLNVEEIRSQIISKEKARKKYGINGDTFVICSVGRLEKIKNISFLIEIFNHIAKKKSNVVLLIAGDGTEKYEIEKKVSKYNIANKVILLGNVSDVISIYCAADVFCMPSISEASPMALHEAQLCNTRSVVSFGVPSENIFCKNVSQLDISDSIENWSEYILNGGPTITPSTTVDEFNIENVKEKLKKIYLY